MLCWRVQTLVHPHRSRAFFRRRIVDMEWARFRLTRNWRSAGEVSGSVAGAGAYSRAVHADPI